MRIHWPLPILIILMGLCLVSCETAPEPEAKPSPERRAGEPAKRYVVPDELQSKLAEAERSVHDVLLILQPNDSKPTKDELLSKINNVLPLVQTLDGAIT